MTSEESNTNEILDALKKASFAPAVRRDGQYPPCLRCKRLIRDERELRYAGEVLCQSCEGSIHADLPPEEALREVNSYLRRLNILGALSMQAKTVARVNIQGRYEIAVRDAMIQEAVEAGFSQAEIEGRADIRRQRVSQIMERSRSALCEHAADMDARQRSMTRTITSALTDETVTASTTSGTTESDERVAVEAAARIAEGAIVTTDEEALTRDAARRARELIEEAQARGIVFTCSPELEREMICRNAELLGL